MISIAQTPTLKLHLQAAIGSMALALVVTGFLVFDRRAPFEYISTEVTPRPVSAGSAIVVHRHVVWNRRCEGEAWTEIVSEVDRTVTNYDRAARYPFELGDTFAERTILLPWTMRPGAATYRGVIRFSACGLTSRWRPIDVPYQQVTFEVR